jgi:hypothetical protein
LSIPVLPSVTIQVASFNVKLFTELRDPEILLLNWPGERYTTPARNNLSRFISDAAKQA